MNIEDYFITLAWICVDKIEKEILLETLSVNIDKSVKWKNGYELIINSPDEKIFLNFKIENWEIIVGNYFFIDNNSLKEVMNELSEKSKEVNSFAIDVWSSFYCYSKSINGENVRFWTEDEYGIVHEEGNVTKEESKIIENEKANLLLQLANQATIRFELIEDFLSTNEVQILK